jgi:hypothetical protein
VWVFEEDVFLRAVAQPASHRPLTVAGCRILARQFCERVEMRQARATEHAREGAERVGHTFACPFDLHALLPVPASILQVGPIHPEGFCQNSRQPPCSIRSEPPTPQARRAK